MNISELIKKLTELQSLMGDVPVMDPDGFPVIGVSADDEESTNTAPRVYIESEY